MERRSCEDCMKTVPGGGIVGVSGETGDRHELGRRLRGQSEEEGQEAPGWRGAGQDPVGPPSQGY